MQQFAEGYDWWFILSLADLDEEVIAVKKSSCKKGGCVPQLVVSGVLS